MPYNLGDWGNKIGANTASKVNPASIANPLVATGVDMAGRAAMDATGISKSPVGNALGNAALGAGTGAITGGPVGAAVGGGLGLLSGVMNAPKGGAGKPVQAKTNIAGGSVRPLVKTPTATPSVNQPTIQSPQKSYALNMLQKNYA